MVNRIQIKRGNLSDIPILSVGEFGFATDVEQVYIGTSSSNIKILTSDDQYTLPVASATLGGIKSGTDITVDGSGNISVNDDSHAHIISNVDGLSTALTVAGSGGIVWGIPSTTPTTAITLRGYLINSSISTFTLLLPVAPIEGDMIGVCDYTSNASSNNIIIDSNTNNIRGDTDNLIIDLDGAGFILVYTDATRGWEIVSEITSGYIHPTYPGDNIDVDTTLLSGATIVSDIDINITTDVSGHVTDANGVVATRTLTLANLGYTGTTDANTYVLPVASATLGGVKSGSDITVDGSGNVLVNDDSHAHIISNVDGLQSALDAKATPANISTAITNLVESSPATMDTLNELAAALGDDPSFATTVSTSIGTKLAKLSNLSDLDNVVTARTNLGVDVAGTINYTHPTYTARIESGDTTALTGAIVISDIDFNISSDIYGHITACDITTLSTRELTLANLGYTGTTDANTYVLPVASTTLGGVKSGSDITVDGSGNVTLNIIDGGEI